MPEMTGRVVLLFNSQRNYMRLYCSYT